MRFEQSPGLTGFVSAQIGKGRIGSTGEAVFGVPLRLPVPNNDEERHTELTTNQINKLFRAVWHTNHIQRCYPDTCPLFQ